MLLHPFQLNDIYDCFKFLLKAESDKFPDYQRYYEKLSRFLGAYLEVDFDNLRCKFDNGDDLNKILIDDFWHNVFNKIGIVSMSYDPNDMYMWSHYSSHRGFKIKYDINTFKENEKEYNSSSKAIRGPFPINYQNEFQKLNLLESKDLREYLLYATNIKAKDPWEYEDEWRLLFTGEYNMYDPSKTDTKDDDILRSQLAHEKRKFFYPIEAIKEITLGAFFFEENILPVKGASVELSIHNLKDAELKKEILYFMYTYQHQLELSMMAINGNQFELAPFKIQIDEINDNEIKFKYL